MRSRDPKLMKQIHDYINEFYIAEERTPTTTEIASAFSISRSSAYRYLVYLSENHDRQRALDVVRASSSLPFVSKIVEVDGIPMLDGGIADSIPVQHAIDMGWQHNVVVLTRNKGWRDMGKDRKIPYLFKNYPRLRVALSHRHRAYNEQIQLVDDLEAAGKITCIRPIRPLEVGRIEKDTDKLERLYEEGFMLGEAFCEKCVEKE